MKEDPPSKRKGDRRFQDGYLHAFFMLADMLDHTMIEEAKSPEERQEATKEAELEHSRLRSPWSDLVGTVLGPVTDNPLRVQVIWDGTGAVNRSSCCWSRCERRRRVRFELGSDLQEGSQDLRTRPRGLI
jgi:hypothetical protein